MVLVPGNLLGGNLILGSGPEAVENLFLVDVPVSES
jgi:hypothetical protein